MSDTTEVGHVVDCAENLVMVHYSDDGHVEVPIYPPGDYAERDENGNILPAVVLRLHADDTRFLGNLLHHAAGHAEEDDGRPHLKVVPTEGGPA